MSDLEAELARLRAGIADGSLGGRGGGAGSGDTREVATQTGEDDANRGAGRGAKTAPQLPPPRTELDPSIFDGQGLLKMGYCEEMFGHITVPTKNTMSTKVSVYLNFTNELWFLPSTTRGLMKFIIKFYYLKYLKQSHGSTRAWSLGRTRRSSKHPPSHLHMLSLSSRL